jgi:hypothetical protein
MPGTFSTRPRFVSFNFPNGLIYAGAWYHSFGRRGKDGRLTWQAR